MHVGRTHGAIVGTRDRKAPAHFGGGIFDSPGFGAGAAFDSGGGGGGGTAPFGTPWLS